MDDFFCAPEGLGLAAFAGVPSPAGDSVETLLNAALANLAAFEVSHGIIRHDPLFALVKDQVQRAREALRGNG